jgi:hypothetical protein
MPRLYRKFAVQPQKPKPVKLGKGFYEMVLEEAEKLDFETVMGAEGLDEEIALLRVKIKAVLAEDPKNFGLIMEATNLVSQLVKARHYIADKEKTGLGEAIKNIIKDIAVPAGIAILKKDL